MTHKRSTYSTLLHVAQVAGHLSEHHLRHHYRNGDMLDSLISSALNNLLKCMDIISLKPPISRLPAEILDMIFFGLHEEELAQPPRERLTKSSRFPHSISCVSRAWSNHVKNRPLLWTVVDVSHSLGFPFTALWFARSLPLPIHLNIMAELVVGNDSESAGSSEPDWSFQPHDHSESSESEANSDIEKFGDERFSDLVYAHLPRCRTISIVVDREFEFLEEALRTWCEGIAAPHLESFTLQAPMSSRTWLDQPSFGGDAPNLRCVRTTPIGITAWNLPLADITMLHLETQDVLYLSEMFTALCECSQLETLTISGGLLESSLDPEDDRPGSESLPHLHSLQLYNVDVSILELLNHLNDAAPALESLALCPYYMDHLQQDGGSHFPMITSLKSIKLAPQDDNVEQSLALASTHFPNVEHVTLMCEVNPQLRALSLPIITNDGTLFPNVRSLDFE